LVGLTLQGGDLGAKADRPRCERCGGEVAFKGCPKKGVHGLKVELGVPRAYYVCPACESSLFPLDRQLRLRRDSWSEGEVRAVAWLSTMEAPFGIVAETLSQVVGVWISTSTVWRCHKEVAERQRQRLAEEEQELTDWAGGGEQEKQRVAAYAAVGERAGVSVDAALIRSREEGYREVKVVSVSEVGERRRGRRKGRQGCEQEDELKLRGHSYRAVLGDKGAFEPGLRAELVLRRVMDAAEITSVNDGADWISDLVQRHLAEKRVEVLDWSHAVQKKAKAAAAAWGEGTAEAQAWLAQRKADLWEGQVAALAVALLRLPRRRKERGKVIRNVQEYVAQHAARMDYARFRAEERPIGSGTVESAAKNVVQ
jgi:hypothetical protein